MAGFIKLEDGRAYAASNLATDVTVRAIANEVADPEFGAWLYGRQSEFRGMGMTSIDLREVAPRFRPVFYQSARRAYARACVHGFEELRPGTPELTGWLALFSDLITMIGLWEAGKPPEEFNPHMKELLPPTGRQEGPGWEDEPDDPSSAPPPSNP